MDIREKSKPEETGSSDEKSVIPVSGKRTVARIAVLAIVFFIALVPAVYMNTIYGYLPAIFLAVLLILSAALLKRLGKRVDVKTNYSNTQCERGASVDAGISIVNHSRIMCPKVISYLAVSDLFGEADAASGIYMTLAAHSENAVNFDLDMSHIGVYKIGIRGMELYDFFGIFQKNLPVFREFEVSVLPKIRDLDEQKTQEMATAESMRETRTRVPNGSDYIGVREYELGDSMKQIHWKLSAHSREYMTKLYESNRETVFSVILDFAASENDNTEELMDINDCLIETALSILAEISRRHTQHFLVYCGKNQEMRRITVQGRADDVDLIRDFAMIQAGSKPDFPDAAELLRREQQAAGGSSNLIIVTSKVTDELVQEMLSAMRRQKIPELYYVIPARLNSRERENLGKPLLALDEVNIPHYFVSTDENLKAHSAGTVNSVPA